MTFERNIANNTMVELISSNTENDPNVKDDDSAP